jgi:hypothetical protein
LLRQLSNLITQNVGLHYILDKGREKIAGKGKDRYCYSAETKRNGGSKSCHEYNNTRNEIPEHSGEVCPGQRSIDNGKEVQ